MRAHFVMGLSAVCFSVIGVLVKMIGESVPVMSLVFLRFFIGLVFLAAILPFVDRNTFRVNARDAKAYFVVGFLMAVTLALFVAANLFAPVQNVVLINRVSPFFVFILASIFLMEKATKRKIVSLAVAFIGLAIINPFQSGNFYFGNMLALGSALCGALMIIGMRREDKEHSIGDVFWFFFFATLILSPAVFLFGFGNILKVWHLVLLLGVVGTGLAYLLYNLALERMGAEDATIISTIITPIFAIQLAVLVIGEPLSEHVLLGGALLIGAGIYLEVHRKNIREAEEKIEDGIEKVEENIEEIEREVEGRISRLKSVIADGSGKQDLNKEFSELEAGVKSSEL